MATTEHQVVLFADLVGSSRLFESLGDSPARIQIRAVQEHLTQIVNAHSGCVIKTIGDELMCLFPSADRAVLAAGAMQRDLESTGNSRMVLRIGLHAGVLIKEKDDVFGDAVNLAARMVDLAKAREIITTRETAAQLPEELEKQTRFLNKIHVHGRQKAVAVCDILWDEESDPCLTGSFTTTIPTDLIPEYRHRTASRLNLEHAGTIIVVNSDNPVAGIGRFTLNSIAIHKPWVSRQHATIEWRNDTFYLIDHSRHGTAICPEKGEEYFAHRTEVQLQANGIIYPGEKDQRSAIDYHVRSELT